MLGDKRLLEELGGLLDEKKLLQAGVLVGKREFLEKNMKNSFFAGLGAFLVAGLLMKDFVVGVFVFAGCFAGAFVALNFLVVDARRKAIAEEAEAGLPSALLKASVLLDLNQRFEKVLEKLSLERGALGKEFGKAVVECKKGNSVQKALAGVGDRVFSKSVKRAVMQLVFVYENMHTKKKKSGESLRMLARELSAIQRVKLKEFSGKMAMYSLFFIALSAIVPAMFESYSIVGSIFLEMSFTPLQLFLVIALVFPAVDALALALFWQKTPKFLKGEC